MRKLSAHAWKRLRSERGVAALEFAIVAQLLMLLLYGMLTYGFVFALDHDITHAAAEGARATLSQPNSDTDQQLIDYAVQTAQNNISFGAARTCGGCVTADVSHCDAQDASIRCIHVRIDYPYRAQPLVPAFAGMQYLVPADIVADSTVELD